MGGTRGRLANPARTAQDRLLHPTEHDIATIAALVDRSLVRLRGELVLQIAPSSLSHTTPSALLDAPDPSTAPDPNAVVLDTSQVDTVLSTLRQAVASLNAEVSLLHNPYDARGKPKTDEGVKLTTTASAVNDDETALRWRAKALRVLVRRRPEGAEDLIESRVAVVGNVDAGKSSLLGVLTRGRLDDGRGRARVALFRHKHEVETGRTSSVGNEILGFEPNGEIIVPEEHQRVQDIWETTASKASKVVSFSDLAGHERYLATTLAGLTGTAPDFVLLIVGANAGLIGMSKVCPCSWAAPDLLTPRG